MPRDNTTAKAVQRRRAEIERANLTDEKRRAEQRHLDEVELHRLMERKGKRR